MINEEHGDAEMAVVRWSGLMRGHSSLSMEILKLSAGFSLQWFCLSRSWGSGLFSPVSLAGACCRTRLGPLPSPGADLWLSGRFPGKMAYFSPQSCAPEPPSLPDCRERNKVRPIPTWNAVKSTCAPWYLMVVLLFLFRSFIPILSLYKAAERIKTC